MKNVKQVIIVRKDLKLSKSKVIALATAVASKFLTENNEATRQDELYVKLSQEEVEWLQTEAMPTILGINSQRAIADLTFQAELLGINVHVITDQTTKSGESTILCASIGPDEEELVNKITDNLKSI